MSEAKHTGILDPSRVTGISEEKKEYYAMHGFVPYQVNGGRVKWAQKSHAIREVQAFRYRSSHANPLRELRTNFCKARRDNGFIPSLFIALTRFLDESR